MAKFLKFSVLFLSLLPVVLPCIYASELFFFDASKKADDGIAKSVEEPEKAGKDSKMNEEESQKVEKV